MTRPPVRLLGLWLIAALLVLHAPIRHLTLTVIRWPFTCLKTVAEAAWLLPRLPSLRAEQERLRADLLQARREATQLSEALRSAERASALNQAWPLEHGIVAAVIGRSTVPLQHTVLINQGLRHGVALESVVMEVAGVAGRVVEAQPATALVLLLTDPDSRVAAAIERSRESGLLIGTGTGQCQLMYLDAQADVQEGDQVVTAGLGGAFPRGLPLGVVTRITRQTEAGSATAWVRPAVPLGQLEDVLCLPPPAAP